MTTYQVNSESVFHAAHTARATIGRVQADLQQLTQSLQALQGSWSGTAATAFQSVVSEWRATQTAVEGQLIQITESLGLAAQHSVDMEAQNAWLFMR